MNGDKNKNSEMLAECAMLAEKLRSMASNSMSVLFSQRQTLKSAARVLEQYPEELPSMVFQARESGASSLIPDELATDIIFHALVDIRGQPFLDTQINDAFQECREVWARVKPYITAPELPGAPK